MTITIPPEALEAVARVLHDHGEIFDDLPWEDLSEDDQECYIEEARAALQAGLKAWPGIIETEIKWKHPGDSITAPSLILPLPMENTNVES